MEKTVSDLKSLREQLVKRRAEAAYAITDDLDHNGIDKLAMIDLAIGALDKVIAEGARDLKTISLKSAPVPPL
jgi:hypothetical protein